MDLVCTNGIRFPRVFCRVYVRVRVLPVMMARTFDRLYREEEGRMTVERTTPTDDIYTCIRREKRTSERERE